MNPSPSLHARIAHAFDDQEVRTLCFDRFPTVYREFTTGMTSGQMIGLLLDYCVRHKAGGALLDALEHERPGLVGGDRDVLLAWFDAARLDPASVTASDTSGQTIVNQASNTGVQGIFNAPVYVGTSPAQHPGNAPPLPALLIGRDADVLVLKARLDIGGTISGATHVLTAMRGWPGVGKTSLVAALAHDAEIMHAFPDGVLWASLGQQPNVFAELAAWGRALGVPDLNQARTTEEVSALLRGLLRNQRRLLIVDDAWQAEHVLPFTVGGKGCALLVTTRLPEVARQIAPVPDDVYVLGVLALEDALHLLRTLAPTVVAANEATCRELVTDLEGLPLALQVAGRLLHTEASYGFGVTQLLADIRAGAALIAAQAPADRADVANATTPTIAALLALSTDHLDDVTLERFAYLGVFVPKPAIFALAAVQEVWDVADAQPTIRTLIDRGLLEPVGAGEFWMHAILVVHAQSFWEEE